MNFVQSNNILNHFHILLLLQRVLLITHLISDNKHLIHNIKNLNIQEKKFILAH